MQMSPARMMTMMITLTRMRKAKMRQVQAQTWMLIHQMTTKNLHLHLQFDQSKLRTLR
jgi:hypothetical protein